ncbi:DUF58 domain-containing protein [Nocardioides nanhaiensis]|uniref:DUF58 domain-containing protein n=1 Tax=Nocardioides nanhaiensis TaxID=1476871 RepID=A0ABP8WEB2_9ACTN
MAELSLPDLGRPVGRFARPLRVLTTSGRSVLLLGVVGLVVGVAAGWPALRVVGLTAVLLLLVALGLVRLPARARGRLELVPDRTTAGEHAGGVLHAVWEGGEPLSGALVDLDLDVSRPSRTGAPAATVRLPVLRRGTPGQVRFALPPLERGVRRVGPATTRRTDPLGLVVRRMPLAAAVELYVRPRMIGVEHLGPGFVRDLEGTPSDEISMSDLSFHALREYVRGDDLRHVHWRSSARVGQLHVRQYHDTRRSHGVVLVDDTAAAFGGPRELELALSVAASVLVRLAQDGVDLTFGCGAERATGPVRAVLDATCRARMGSPGDGLVDAARRLAAQARDASLLVLVGGRGLEARAVQQARAVFPADVRVLVLRADTSPEARSGPGGPGTLVVADLDDLPRLLAAAARGALGVVS